MEVASILSIIKTSLGFTDSDLQIQFTSDIQECADKILSTSSYVHLSYFNSTLSRKK